MEGSSFKQRNTYTIMPVLQCLYRSSTSTSGHDSTEVVVHSSYVEVVTNVAGATAMFSHNANIMARAGATGTGGGNASHPELTGAGLSGGASGVAGEQPTGEVIVFDAFVHALEERRVVRAASRLKVPSQVKTPTYILCLPHRMSS